MSIFALSDSWDLKYYPNLNNIYLATLPYPIECDVACITGLLGTRGTFSADLALFSHFSLVVREQRLS